MTATSEHPGEKRAKAWLWDAEGGGLLKERTLSEGEVTYLAVSPDPKTPYVVFCLAKADKKGGVRLWDPEAGLDFALGPHERGQVNYAAFSAGGSYLVTAAGEPGGDAGEVQLWDVKHRKRLARRTEEGAVVYAAFSPDREGGFVLTATLRPGGGAGVAKLWDVKSLDACEPLWVLEHPAPINYAAFSRDGRYLATASGKQGDESGEARVWDVKQPDRPPRVLRHKGAVWYVAFSPDGRYLATAGDDAAARVWRVPDGEAVLEARHHSTVFSAEFSPDGRYLLTGSRDRTARVWDLATGEPAFPPLCHTGTVGPAWFSPDGRRLLTVSQSLAWLWEMTTANPAPKPLPTGGRVTGVGCSADGRFAITLSESPDGGPAAARVWDTSTGAPVRDLPRDAGEARTAALRPDGLAAVTVTSARGKNVAHVWDVKSGRRSAPPIPLGPGVVNNVALSPDGRYLVVCGGDLTGNTGQAEVWEVRTRRMVHALGHKGGVIHAAFRPGAESRYVATASADDSARVWDVSDGKPVGEPLRHTADVTHVSFSADGRHLITASADQTAAVWQVDWEARRVEKRATLRHGSYLNHAGLSRDSRYALTAGHDGAVKLWYLARGLAPEGARADRDRPELVAVVRPGGDVRHASFGPGGDSLVTVGYHVRTPAPGEAPGGPGSPPPGGDRADPLPRGADAHRSWRWVQACRWDIAPDRRPAERLGRLARLLSAREPDADASRVLPIDPEREGLLAEDWDNLRQEYQTGFPARPPREEHRRQADECEAAEQWFAAEWHLTRLIKNHPPDEPLLRGRRARARAHLGQLDKAVEDYKSALRRSRKSWELWAGLAEVRVARGEWEEAVRCYSEAITLRRAKDWRLLEGRARARAALARWEEAIRDYSRAIQLNDANVRLHAARARTLAQLRRWDEVVKDYTRAIKLDPTDGGLLVRRALAYAEQEDWGAAIEDLAAATRLKPDDILTWRPLPAFQLQAKREKEYRRTCEGLLRQFGRTESPQVANSVAWVCSLAPKAVGDPGAVVRLVRVKALRHAPRDPKYLNTLGAALYRAGKAKEAIAQLKGVERAAAAREGGPGKSATTGARAGLPLEETWLLLALAHHRLGEDEEARRWLRQAAERMDAPRPKGAEDTRPPWKRVEGRLLRREAEALLKPGKPATNKGPQPAAGRRGESPAGLPAGRGGA